MKITLKDVTVPRPTNNPAAYETMHRPKDPGVPPVPDAVQARLRPLDGREYRTLEPFRADLAGVLTFDEMQEWRGQVTDAALATTRIELSSWLN